MKTLILQKFKSQFTHDTQRGFILRMSKSKNGLLIGELAGGLNPPLADLSCQALAPKIARKAIP